MTSYDFIFFCSGPTPGSAGVVAALVRHLWVATWVLLAKYMSSHEPPPDTFYHSRELRILDRIIFLAGEIPEQSPSSSCLAPGHQAKLYPLTPYGVLRPTGNDSGTQTRKYVNPELLLVCPPKHKWQQERNRVEAWIHSLWRKPQV